MKKAEVKKEKKKNVLPFRLSNGITVNFVSEKELYECFTFRYNLLEILVNFHSAVKHLLFRCVRK